MKCKKIAKLWQLGLLLIVMKTLCNSSAIVMHDNNLNRINIGPLPRPAIILSSDVMWSGQKARGGDWHTKGWIMAPCCSHHTTFSSLFLITVLFRRSLTPHKVVLHFLHFLTHGNWERLEMRSRCSRWLCDYFEQTNKKKSIKFPEHVQNRCNTWTLEALRLVQFTCRALWAV